MPVPPRPRRVVKKGSKMRGSTAASMPRPLSLTTMWSKPLYGSSWLLTWIAGGTVRGGVASGGAMGVSNAWSCALPTRFSTTCPSGPG